MKRASVVYGHQGGELQDIDFSISHQKKAVESTPSCHTKLVNRLANLGNSYLRRFEHIGDLQDIDHAISHHQKAVESTPSVHASLANLLNNLGTSYI